MSPIQRQGSSSELVFGQLIHDANVNRPQPALLHDDLEMQSEMRNRNHTVPNPAVNEPGNDANLPQPGPSQESRPNIDENNRFISWGKAFWQRLANYRYLFEPTAETQRIRKLYRYDDLGPTPMESFPKGYPRFADFLSSNDSFANYRKFGRLSARILAHLQLQLTKLEKELDALDLKDAADPVMKKRLHGSHGFETDDKAQEKLISIITTKWLEYAKVLSKAAELHSLGRTSERDHRSLLHWVIGKKPFPGGKYDFVFQANDFVSLTRQSQNGRKLETLIESWFGDTPPQWLKNIMQGQKERSKTEDQYVTHWSASRVYWLANTVTVSLAAGILFVPVYLLFLIPMSRAMMVGVSSVSVVAFAILLSVITDAKMQEVFIGSAAYAAVLTTFLGNIDNINGSFPA